MLRKRAALKAEGDYEALDKLPKNASPVRLHNRCKLTGRPRGYMRKFGISRVTFREMASDGKIPGINKSQLVISFSLLLFNNVRNFAGHLTKM